MSEESSCHGAVERLLTRLYRSGLVKSLELSYEDIADTVWLALQMGVVETKTEEEKDNSQQRKDQVTINDSEETTGKSNLGTDSTIKVYSQDLINQDSDTGIGTKGLPFQVPAAPSLQNKLSISRALRPLMRKVPSTIKTILDPEATVTQIAERDIWLPVTKPEPERWLDLELVVEESPSSFLWAETIDELQKLLQNHGAFRTVRFWSLLSTDNDSLQLTRRRKGGGKSSCYHSYRELIHSDGRGLILLVSDCVSRIWQQGKIHRWLHKWSNKVPTAIMQLFPERLWQSSELGLGYKLQLSAFTPGVPNSALVLPSLWEELKGEEILKLPVITLEDISLRQWSKVLAGRGNSQTLGFVFDMEFVLKQVKKSEMKQLTTDKSQEVLGLAEELVDRFLATASPIAQRLAGLMAAAPVSLPVVNIIQQEFFPHKSTPVNVAEVFLSGMIQRTNATKTVHNPQYDFVPGVRKVLNQATRLGETENVLDVLSSHIADNLGLSIKSFTALLSNHQNFTPEQQEEILPFAEVTIEVLKNLGGEYADFAQEVAPNITVSPPPKPIPNKINQQSLEPERRNCIFKVATIEILETHTFEFYVATLEQESRFFGLSNSWVINRQKQKSTGIVEVIEPGIELELMEIPHGNFTMGAPSSEKDSRNSERPQHQVTVSSFFIGKYPVNQAQWKAVAGLPKVNHDLKADPSEFKGDNLPVEGVSWYDAVEFCDRLNRFVHRSKSSKRQYRLPTEAEWEYACRAGTTTPFHFGETITPKLANYNANYTYGAAPKGIYREKTTPVGSFDVANSFGLYDMHGNVWEWCLDDWHKNYEGAPTDGSAWFDENNNLYQKSGRAVLRGGSWFDNPGYCRSAYRNVNYGAERDVIFDIIGFRVVCAFGRALK